MKIGLLQTHFCTKCQTRVHPTDLTIERCDDDGWFGLRPTEDIIHIYYACNCGSNRLVVKHVVQGDELFPYYALMQEAARRS